MPMFKFRSPTQTSQSAALIEMTLVLALAAVGTQRDFFGGLVLVLTVTSLFFPTNLQAARWLVLARATKVHVVPLVVLAGAPVCTV